MDAKPKYEKPAILSVTDLDALATPWCEECPFEGQLDCATCLEWMEAE